MTPRRLLVSSRARWGTACLPVRARHDPDTAPLRTPIEAAGSEGGSASAAGLPQLARLSPPAGQSSASGSTAPQSGRRPQTSRLKQPNCLAEFREVDVYFF